MKILTTLFSTNHTRYQNYFSVVFSCVLFFFVTNSFAQEITDTTEYGSLVFKSGFEGSSRVSPHPTSIKRQIMTGVDGNYNWQNLSNQVEKAEFFYLTGKNKAHKEFAEAKISNGIGYKNSKGIVLETKKDDPSDNQQTRVEFWMYPDYQNNGVFSTQGFIRYKMKLDKNLNNATWPSHWINFFEVKQGTYPNRNYRFYLTLEKKASDAKPMWVFTRHNVQSDKLFILKNEKIPVPIDKWMDVEIFWKKHDSKGRLFLKINGKVIFDFVGQTQHPTNPQHTDFFSPLKNYRSREWHNGARTSKIWYDDIELWSGFPKDEILSFNAPKNVVVGETYPVSVRIRSRSKRTVQLRLQNKDKNFKSYASLNFNIEKGTRTYTKNIRINTVAPQGNTYQWLSVVTTRNGNWNNRIDHRVIKPINCVRYDIQNYSAPSAVVPGRSYTIKVPYIGRGAAYIRTSLQNKDDGWKSEGSAKVSINGTGKGTATLKITVDKDAKLGNNYYWQTYISPVNGNWDNRYDNEKVGKVRCSNNNKELNEIRDDKINFYPNPADDNLILKRNSSSEEIRSIRIYSLQGKVIKELNKNVLNESDDNSIDVSDITTGIYILSINFQNKNTQNTQFVIRH